MTDNPFAAPAVDAYAPARAQAGQIVGVWRDGDQIVMEKGATLPDFCVKTGAPAEDRLDKKMYWHTPAIYAALLISPIIYVILALILRKTANVSIPVGAEALQNRSKWIKIGWGAGLAGVVLFIVGIPSRLPLLTVLGLVVAMFGLIGGLIGVRLLWPTKIDDQFVYLKGAKEPFLNRLPRH